MAPAGAGKSFGPPINRVMPSIHRPAHRIFDPATVLAHFERLRLTSFSYVDDAGALHEDVSLPDAPKNLSCGCGLFDFTKDCSNS